VDGGVSPVGNVSGRGLRVLCVWRVWCACGVRVWWCVMSCLAVSCRATHVAPVASCAAAVDLCYGVCFVAACTPTATVLPSVQPESETPSPTPKKLSWQLPTAPARTLVKKTGQGGRRRRQRRQHIVPTTSHIMPHGQGQSHGRRQGQGQGRRQGQGQGRRQGQDRSRSRSRSRSLNCNPRFRRGACLMRTRL